MRTEDCGCGESRIDLGARSASTTPTGLFSEWSACSVQPFLVVDRTIMLCSTSALPEELYGQP